MNLNTQSKLLWETLSVAAVVSLFSLLPVMADSFEWSATGKPSSLADDAVQFEYSGDSVSAITVTPVDGGTIWISGDEMPVAADATITFTAPGTLGFSNAVTCAGNLMVNGYGEMTRGWHDGLASTFTTAAELKASLLPTNFVTLFTDMNLDEWEPYAYYGARDENKANPAISTGDITLNPNSSPDYFLEFIERTETDEVKSLRAELTFHGSAVYNVYTIEMRQNGADVQGRLVGFVRDSSHPHKDLKLEEALLDPANAITTRALMHPDAPASTKSGFCISQLTMRRLAPASTLRFEGKLTVPAANKVVIDAKARVMGRIGAATTLSNPATDPTPNFEANGMLTLFDGSEIGGYLAGHISGTGVVEVAGINSRTNETMGGGSRTHTPEEVADTTMDFWDNKYIYNNEFHWLASCRQMLDLTNANAYVLGALNPTPRSYADLYHVKWKNLNETEKILVGQFQAVHSKGISNICCYVEFKQDPNPPYADLHAKLVSAYMVTNDDRYPIGMDFDTIKDTDAVTKVQTGRGSINVTGIALRDIKLCFRTPRAGYLYAPEGESAVNAMGGTPRFVVKGSAVRDQHCILACSNALPASGCVEVKDGGWLHLKAEGVSKKGYSGGGADIIVHKGGKLWAYQREMFGDSQRVRIDGGELRVGIDVKSSVSGPYLEYLTLRNGARVEGHDFKVGNRQAMSYINVCGTSPSFINSHVMTQGSSAVSNGQTNEWRVADVTGNSAADLVVNGDIIPFGSDFTRYTNLVIRKLGPGTVRMNGQFRHFAPVLVTAGTLEFGSNDSANGREFVLNGGALTAADGTANTCAALTVGANGGTIKVSDGTTLAFADSTGAEWLGPVTLTTDDDVFPEGVLKFGSDANGLTAGQVAKMRFNGKRVHLRADGAVSGKPLGLIFTVK